MAAKKTNVEESSGRLTIIFLPVSEFVKQNILQYFFIPTKLFLR